MATRSGWASSTDVAIAASVYALLSLGVRLSMSFLAPGSDVLASTAFSMVGLVIPAGVLYWILGRCWWLIRHDDGHVGLITVGVVASTVAGISVLALVPVSPSFSAPDFVFFLSIGAQMLGTVFFTIALQRWSRMPAWFSRIAYAYLGVLAIGLVWRLMSLSQVVSTASGFANAALFAALAAALFSDARHRSDTTVEVA